MANRKIIGVVGFRTSDDKSFGCGVNHLEYISQFGNARIIMPWEELADVDMLYLPGGLDLNPAVYGQVPMYKTSDQDVHKQYFYDHRLKLYIEAKIPIFGVCLGFQMIASYFGMPLKQDLKFHNDSPGRWEAGHDIKIAGSKEKLKVNSHHHQGLSLKDCKQDLFWVHATSVSGEDFALVEAIQHKTLPIGGVQWHPEEWYDDFSRDLFLELLNTPK